MQPTSQKQPELEIGWRPMREMPSREVQLSPDLPPSRGSSDLEAGAQSPSFNDRQRIHVFLSKWFCLSIVVLTYCLCAWLTWRKWPDLLVDFGEQLYLPWRISAGDVLYRDVMYLTGGPVSQYYHAALFKLFGVSFL